MNNISDKTHNYLLVSSACGVGRNVVLQPFIYPLKTVKVRLQCAQHPKTIIQVIRELMQEGGGRSFYRGFNAQIWQSSAQQLWRWPVMIGVPKLLERYDIKGTYGQILTALTLSTAEATATTPLERYKISAVNGKRKSVSIKDAYKEGWRGFTAHWINLSVNWVAFLTVQDCLRARAHAQSDQPLSFRQRAEVGLKTALIVAAIGTPSDVINSLVQGENHSLTYLFSTKKFSHLLRGCHIHAFSLGINSLTSVIVLDWLNTKMTPTTS